MSFGASRRLDSRADEAADRVREVAEEDRAEAVATLAYELVNDDDLLEDALEAEHRLDSRAHQRRKEVLGEGGSPRSDSVLEGLQAARRQATEAVDDRVEELVRQAIDADVPVDEESDDEDEAGEVVA
ncbi:hypothetical protein GCM10008995_29250 [Halobellus salinus]|uniref:Uncharacterized protein n=1 Tax=Halobellus salinus TaxID=931585 RepID=A0A830ERR5_9EURY|nr:hypothetical protein [Halobellus salinus]GGJ17606.1 hypothetical protein GCM10008995_29250 [Halobellus salinus]SMP35385.1 hypothetical protein SAMN06265347_1307 [Halobellus salinus]